MPSLSSRSTTTPPQNLMGARGAHRVHRTAHRSGAESGDCCAVVPVDVGETRTSPHDCFSCPLYFFLGPFFVSVVGGSVLLCPSSARTACPAACQFSLCIYPDILLMSIEDGGESIGHASRLVWQCGANSPSLGVIHLGKGSVLGGQLMMSLSQPEPLPSRVRASTVTDTYQAAHPAWSCHRVFLPMADWTSSRLWAKQCRLLPGQQQAGLELLPSAVSGS